jgi:predicted phosphohydrolase
VALYAIADLHLALSIDKPMDIFGSRWVDYMSRIKLHWEETVCEKDYVIIAGDISWATYLDQAREDFRFIDDLPGEKIIIKGNHDYWWSTQKKMKEFIKDNNFNTIQFLHNNSILVDDFVICGTRGWICPGEEGFSLEDRKIYERELQRLELSLSSSKNLNNERIIVALHYPPFNNKGEPSEFMELIRKYNVKMCVYGHLHGEGCEKGIEGLIDDVHYRLVSADCLQFKLLKIDEL